MRKASMLGYGMILLALSIVAGTLIMEIAPSFTGMAVYGNETNETGAPDLGITGLAAVNSSWPILNSSWGENRTVENLTVYYNFTVPDIKGIINWYIDNNSIIAVSLPFERSWPNTSLTKDYARNGGNATVLNATFNMTGGYDGRSAYQFNGSTDSMEYSHEKLGTIKDGVTISAWVKSNQEGFIVAKSDYHSQLFFYDDFSDTDGTDLTSHEPRMGTAWTTGYSKNTTVGRIYSNELKHSAYPNEKGNSGYIALTNTTIISSNYNVSIRVGEADSFDDTISIYARWLDSNNYYQIRFSSSSSILYGKLYKRVGGVCTELSADDRVYASKGDNVTLSVVGDVISVYVNKERYMIEVDTSLSSAGKAGVGMGASPCEQGDDSHNQSVDSFRVTMLINNNIPFMMSTVNGGEFSIMKDNVIYNATSSTEINDGEWHHIAGTYNKSEMKIYIDGSLETTGTEFTGYLPVVGETIIIGRNYSNSTTGRFNGTLDELMIYNRSLSAEQIKALYENRTDMIVSDETYYRETWQACVIVNNQEEDTPENCSNTVKIRDPFYIEEIYAPTPQGYGNVSMTANITDLSSQSDIDAVIAEVTAPSGEKTNCTMENSSLYIWETFNCQIYTNGTHTFKVYVNESDTGYAKASEDEEFMVREDDKFNLTASVESNLKTSRDKYYNILNMSSDQIISYENVNLKNFTDLQNLSFRLSARFRHTGEGFVFSQADIVWVLDASGSMWDEQEKIAENAEMFAHSLEVNDIDYQMAVVGYLGMGDTWGGHPYQHLAHSWPVGTDLQPTNPYEGTGEWTTNSTTFAEMVVSVPQNGWIENGLAAMNETLSHYTFREGAKKFFILITDEDDDLYGGAKGNLGDPYLEDINEIMNENDVTVFVVTYPDEFNLPEYVADKGVAVQTEGKTYDINGNFSDIISGLAEEITKDATLSTLDINGTYTFAEWTEQQGGKTVRELVEEDIAKPNSSIPENFYGPEFTILEYILKVTKAEDSDGKSYLDITDAKFAESADGHPIDGTNVNRVEDSSVFILYPKLFDMSYFRNLLEFETSGYMLFKVQYWNGSEYIDNETLLNEFRALSPDNYTWLHEIWNSAPFSTENKSEGRYRAYAAMTDGSGNVLIDSNGTPMNATYEFEIETKRLTPEVCGFTIYEDTTTGGPMGLQNGTVNGACITFGADDITLDCAGNYLVGQAGSGMQYGINITGRRNVTVINCSVEDFDTGIYIWNSTGINLTENRMADNTYNFRLDADSNDPSYGYFDHDIDTSNTVENRSVYIVNGAAGAVYDSLNAGTFYCIDCSDVTFRNLRLSNSYYGLMLVNSNEDITIENSNISSNYKGIYAWHGPGELENINIDSCEIKNNDDVGVYLFGNTTDCSITNSNITGNYDEGIYFKGDFSTSFGDYANHSNITIANNNISGNDAGIFVFGNLLNSEISSNIISENDGRGIEANYDAFYNCTIAHNKIEFNYYAGIVSGGAYDTLISNNSIRDNGDNGIYFYGLTPDTVISHNNISGNDWYGIELSSFYPNRTTITHNTIKGNYEDAIISWNGMYNSEISWNNISGHPVTVWDHGIFLDDYTENVTISNNNIINDTYYAIYIGEGKYITVTDNTVTGGKSGMMFDDSSSSYIALNDSIISRNRVSGQEGDGIILFRKCYNVTLSYNNMTEIGDDAIYGAHHVYNLSIIHNNISNNYGDALNLYPIHTGTIANNIFHNNTLDISYVYDAVIANNSISGAGTCIHSSDIYRTEISGNNITGCSSSAWGGIYDFQSVIFRNNIVKDNYRGISSGTGKLNNSQILYNQIIDSSGYNGFDWSRIYNSTIKYNNITGNNGRGIDGTFLIIDTVISHNNLSNSLSTGIYSWVIENTNITFNEISHTRLYHGINGWALRNSIISSNSIKNSAQSGILFGWQSNDSTISNNTISGGEKGISLKTESTSSAYASYNTLISGNTITNCSEYGIELNGVLRNLSNNRIYNNYITNCSIGLFINGTSNESLVFNNYFNNTVNAIDLNGRNYWNSSRDCGSGLNIMGGTCKGGNFWSDYEGVDDGSGGGYEGDGIGDTNIPYDLGTNVNDYLPLVEVLAMKVALVNSTHGTDYTNENLTCWAMATDPIGGDVTYLAGWNKEGADVMSLLWNATYDGGEEDRGFAIAVDNHGYVYVTGYTQNSSAPSLIDAYTIKYNATTAEEIWSSAYDNGNGKNDKGFGIAVDSSGDVYIAGGFHVNPDYLKNSYFTAKLNGTTGAHIWNATYNTAGDDAATEIDIDNKGGVYVTGYSSYDYYTIKYNATTGEQIWNKTYDSGGSDAAWGIAADNSGYVYVAGYAEDLTPGSEFDYYTIKYNASTGDAVWNKSYDSGINEYDVAYGIDVDNNGGVYVTGKAGGMISLGYFYTIKYNAYTGEEIWNKSYTMPETDYPRPMGISYSELGSVYVVGGVRNINSNFHYATIKYNALTGELERAELLDNFDGSDTPMGVATDNLGNVYVTGYTLRLSMPTPNFYTVKYTGNISFVNYSEGILINVSTIDSSQTSKYEEWGCDAMAYNHLNQTTSYLASNTITILNYAPVVSTPTINSTSGRNLTTENLTCYASAEDIDNDNLTYFGYWRKDGAREISFNTSPANYTSGVRVNVSTINSSETGFGDNWSCEVRAYDWDEYGDYAISTNLTITALFADVSVWDETDAKGGGLAKYPEDMVTFWANYTNSTGGSVEGGICSINFSDINAEMEYNSTTSLFQYNRTFSSEGMLQWNVTCSETNHYTVEESDYVNITLKAASLSIWDEIDESGGTLVKYPDDSVMFWANYTNATDDAIDSATCTIKFTDSSSSMAQNSTSGLYYYSRSFSSAGTYEWNVTCSETRHEEENGTSSVTITSTPSPPTTGGGGGGGGGGAPTPAPEAPAVPEVPFVPPSIPEIPAPTPAPTPSPAPELEIPISVAAPPAGGGCTEVLQRTSTTSLTTREVPIGQIGIPSGYEIVKEPFSIDCRGDSFFMTLNIPSNYKDVRALRCRGGICLTEVETTTTTTFECGEAIAEEIEEEVRFMPAEQMETIISEEKSITEIDRTVETGKNRMEFTTPIPPMLLASIQSPTRQVREPDNPDLNIIGTPIIAKITTDTASAGATITLPYAKEGIEEGSASIYVAQEEGWVDLEGTINTQEQTISVRIDNIMPYLNAMDEAMFAAMAVKCDFCETSEFEKVYHHPGSRDAILLIHGLGSSPETFESMIAEFEYNQQPWQIWTYGYSSSRDIDTVSEELRNLIEAHSLEFDNIYIVAHSLGGLVVQTALHDADQNRARYTFVSKARKAILLGVPNEGSPSAQVIKNLHKYLVNFKDRGGLFNVNSKTIDELITGRIVPRVPGVDYYVLAGTQPYEFNLGLFKVSSGTFEFTEANDGIVTVTSAQHIGENYINNMCENYWEIKVTHTEMLNVQPSVRVIQKILSDSIAEQYTDRNLVGRNQYFKLRIDECSAQDTYLLIGQEIRPEEVADELCGCGNSFCGEGEDALNCPSDCASIVTLENALLSGPIIIYTLTILTYLTTLLYTFKKHIFKKRGGRKLPFALFILAAGATALYRTNFGIDLIIVYITLPLAIIYMAAMDRIMPRIMTAAVPVPAPAPAPVPKAVPRPAAPQKLKIPEAPEPRKEHLIKRFMRRKPETDDIVKFWTENTNMDEINRLKERASSMRKALQKDIGRIRRQRKNRKG